MSGGPLRIFCGFDLIDDAFLKALEKWLAPLERQGLLTVARLLAGDMVAEIISTQLGSADIALFLISPDLLASPLFLDLLAPIALEKQRTGTVRVVPVLVRPVEFEACPFGHLSPLPSNKVPVSSWRDKDAAWKDVLKGVRDLMATWSAATKPSLVIDDGPLQGQRLVMETGRTYLLGRDPQAHLKLPEDDPKVSRGHVLIEVSLDGVVARDLKSKNGIYVNERRVTTAVLHAGDRLRIGRTSIRLLLPGPSVPSVAQTPAPASTETDSQAADPPVDGLRKTESDGTSVNHDSRRKS